MTTSLVPPPTTDLGPRRGAGTPDLLAGARAMMPLALAVTPIGLTIGLALGRLPVDHLAAWSSSSLIYAGSAQLVAVTTYAAQPSGIAAIFAALVVNARLLFYSAALAPHWRDRPLAWRVIAAYLLIDPSFVHAQQSYARPGSASAKARFYLGGGILLWMWWQLVTGIGLLTPALVPHADALWAAAPLCFVAVLAGGVRGRARLTAAFAAAAVSVSAGGLPWGAGLLLAMIAGVAAGAFGQRRRAEVPA